MKITIAVLLVLMSSTRGVAQPENWVRLQPAKHLRKGVDAWPLIANPATPAERNVNATLARLNVKMRTTLVECDRSYRRWANVMNQHPLDKGAEYSDWERNITITMAGPHFLSLVAKDSAFCGGAYPDDQTLALVFDLSTGKPVNWMSLIAESANARTFSDSTSDGTIVGALTVPALRELSITHASKDCKDVFESSQAYQLWPTARTGVLVAEPFGLPHFAAARAVDLKLSMDQGRKLGFSERILTAIAQAHQQYVARPHRSLR